MHAHQFCFYVLVSWLNFNVSGDICFFHRILDDVDIFTCVVCFQRISNTFIAHIHHLSGVTISQRIHEDGVYTHDAWCVSVSRTFPPVCWHHALPLALWSSACSLVFLSDVFEPRWSLGAGAFVCVGGWEGSTRDTYVVCVFVVCVRVRCFSMSRSRGRRNADVLSLPLFPPICVLKFIAFQVLLALVFLHAVLTAKFV